MFVLRNASSLKSVYKSFNIKQNVVLPYLQQTMLKYLLKIQCQKAGAWR